MSTTKPRITITLEPRTHEILTRLSAAGGDSMSQIVTGFLEIGVPAMERMVVVMEQARAAPQAARDGLADAVARAEAKLLPALTAALKQQDLFLVDAARSMKAATAGSGRAQRARGPAAVPLTPVPVTRGSGRTKAQKVRVNEGKSRGAV